MVRRKKATLICDIHSHCLPEALGKFLMERYDLNPMKQPVFVPVGTPVSDTDDELEARMRMMDDAGVQVQVLSVVLPSLSNEVDTVHAIQLANDAHARVAQQHPSRFKVFAELPLPYLGASLKELDRCRNQLGIDAVKIPASHGVVSAVSQEFDPLFDVLDDVGAVVFFHPRGSALCSPLLTDYALGGPLGSTLEDTVLVFQMLTRQFPLRYPNLKMIIPHLGGILPIYMERMDNQMGRLVPDLPEPPSVTVRRLWFDSMSHCSAVALRSACEAFGADRIVTGSDYPAMQHFQGYKASLEYIRDAGLPAQDVERILHINAPQLLGLI